MAEDLGKEDVVGHVFGFEEVARDGAVGGRRLVRAMRPMPFSR